MELHGIDLVSGKDHHIKGMIRGISEWASIYTHDNDVDLTSVAQNDWNQIVAFDHDGDYYEAVPAHGSDHITVATTGVYYVSYHWAGHGHANHQWHMHVAKNNNDETFDSCSQHFHTPTASRLETVQGSNIITLTAGDTVELWVQRTTAGSNIRLATEDVTLTLFKVV